MGTDKMQPIIEISWLQNSNTMLQQGNTYRGPDIELFPAYLLTTDAGPHFTPQQQTH